MKPRTRITLATAALGAGAVFVLNWLGYVTTIISLFPDWLRNSVVADPYPLYAALLLFAVAIALLWNVAWNTSQATKEYRKSNERAWAFSAEMGAFKEEITARQNAVEAKLGELIAAVRALADEVAAFRRERDDTMKEAREIANTALNEAATQAASAIQIKLGQQREHAAAVVEGKLTEFRNQMASNHQQLMATVEPMVERVVSERVGKEAK